ncbi:YbaY family lipoprotein [Candidatus Bipolaricaulota bacterium]|nr:YbaY family lipoprotein [Candidatus Bipolaricaulota bacterium]
MPTVRGSIRISGDDVCGGSATAYVRVLDVSLADAPSVTVGELVLTNVSIDEVVRHGLEFSLWIDNVEVKERNRYVVSVLIDCDGDADMGTGDYYSKQAYPVFADSSPDYVVVETSRLD